MRNIKVINSEWLFTKNAKSAPATLPSDWEQLNLPYTWNGKDGQDGGNDYYRGTCYFAKKIVADEIPEGDVKYIQFDGVNSSSEVFWNGEKIAVHHGGYSTFRAKLENIKDENLLVVSVDNSANDKVYPQQADFTFYGGIYRDVSLIGVNKNHFDLDYYGAPGIMVTPKIEGKDAIVNVKAFADCDDDCKAIFTITDASGEVVVMASGDDDYESDIKILGVHLWDGIRDPYLYTMTATLVKDGVEVDKISTRFGCRTFEIDANKGFILNGREYPLRGVSRHQDRPDVGNALTPEMHKEDLDLILEMGANTIRLAHYQHSQVFYNLCDEAGLVLWAEIPYISSHMKDGYDNTISQMKELVAQNYNHPSIVVWGLSNEITIAGSNPNLIKNHKDLNDLVHEMDKTRLTTIAAVSMCDINDEYVHISDVLSYNHYFGWYGGSTEMNGPWFDNFHKKYPNKPIGLSEYGCEALDWHTSTPTQGDYTEEYQAYYHEELIKQIAERPYLWATHVWNMYDFAADARAEGGENGMNHKGLVTFDRKYKKDSYYAYQAWLSEKPMIHLCSKKYIDRVEDVTKVTVYSNCSEVELFANGISVGKQTKGKYPFFYFEVKNEGETELKAVAGELSDTAIIRKVDTPNEAYIMKEEGQVINWFEISTPDGYFSINNTIGDIMSTFKGKLVMVKFLMMMAGAMKSTSNGEKTDDGEEKNAGMIAGFKLTPAMLKNVYGMAKGFTIKRCLSMTGNMFSKEQILEINAKLNKVKMPKKK